jgi:hypothetical protein
MRQFYSSNYIRTMLESELFERKLMDRVIDIATEGRGAADPPEEPEPERTEDGSTIIEAEVVENESAGVLPEDRSIAIDEAEAVAASDTVVPEVDEQAAKEPERA